MEGSGGGNGFLICGKWAIGSIKLQGELVHSGSCRQHETKLTTVQAGEFFIENVLKKRRAAAAKQATAELAASNAPATSANAST